MRGNILDFNIQTGFGLISGDDGKRYSFVGAEWKDTKLPVRGMKVDFDVQEGNAIAIYTLTKSGQSGPQSQNIPEEYQGFYRSSDEKTFGGVCAGLAHKWNMNRSALKVIFVILGFFYLAGVLAYIILWIGLKQLPTKDVRFD